MAESGNVTSVFPGNSDNARFAEDMVGYVVLLNTPEDDLEGRQGELRELSPDFDIDAEMVVEAIVYKLKNINIDILRKMETNKYLCLTDYRKFAYNESLNCSAESFDANIFIIFCVSISNMAALFYSRGILQAPVFAIMRIMYVLAKYDASTSGWDALRTAARSLETPLPVNEQTQQNTTSSVIEHLDLLARDISRYVSMKYSLNRSVLPEYKEMDVSNLENIKFYQYKRLLRDNLSFIE